MLYLPDFLNLSPRELYFFNVPGSRGALIETHFFMVFHVFKMFPLRKLERQYVSFTLGAKAHLMHDENFTYHLF